MCSTMDSLTIILLLSSILYTSFLLLTKNPWSRRKSNLPPGPTPLPFIGNILQLGQKPHRSLANLAKTYGPLMHLKLGSIHTIVASSPQIAREVLLKHDHTCSSRAVPHVAHVQSHYEASVAWLPVGSKWRKLRKISKEHMFAPHKLEASEPLRQEKLKQLRDYLKTRGESSSLVNFEEVAFVTSLNLISATLFSLDFASFDSDSTQREMKECIQGLMKISGTPNMADFFPILRMVDPQGLKRKAEVYFVKLVDKFDEIVGKRLQEREQNSLRKKDMLEVLLDLNEEDDANMSRHEIKHLLFDLFIAATDTTTDSVQWTMSELIRNPSKLSKAKDELRAAIEGEDQVQESDIPKLPYLTAVIKESFRLHPAGPFLIPHKAESDVEINGYTIPKNARILVNVWAIGRDPTVWPDPESFEPERFVGSKIDYKGQDFGLLPFGSGRRICPGLPLAHLMVHLMVASMIHKFDWKGEDDDVDMDDVFGLSLHKARPLMAFPVSES